MSSQNNKDLINSTVCNVLEHTAFLFPEVADLSEGIEFEDFDFVRVRLNISGDEDGEVMMMAPAEFCLELSANMLGEDIKKDESVEKHMDALKEALNIITGQLLTEIYGEKAVFDLSAPEAEVIEKEAFFELISKHDYSLVMSDEFPVITIFSVKKEANEHQSVGS